ncbi:MAG TPA: thiol-activated cytolysin family protein [Candidatus Krumholzibacteria bacterium]|nr:thiol-activated cytolysin family protein [Candidatus Krumholzibacteria bacterium]
MTRSRTPLWILFAALAVTIACGQDDPVALDSTDPVDPAEVNQFVNGLPNWEIPSDFEEPPVDLGAEEDFEASQYYRCEAVEYDLKRNFEDIIAVGANATALKPGMIVQGNGVKDGSLSTIGLKRSPLSLSVNLALADPSRTVDAPTSSTIQDAIASLQRDADDRLGNLDVIPAQINFRAESAYSVQQALITAGLSVRYSGIIASGSVGGSLSQSTSVKKRSVVVKLMQPMYTISFADDEKAEPADFFASDLMEADFERQRQQGTMGPGNLPCYVQSVTYGRMVVYSMTTTETTSDEEYKLAVQASYGAWSGSGSINTRQRELVQNSTVEVQVFGGTQGAGLDAIKQALRNGDFSAFLQPAPATTAVPLSYRINDLKNRQPAVIGDATKFTIRECEPVNDLQFTVTLDSIIVVDGCVPETSFDIESWVYPPQQGRSYWLLHNTGTRFPKETLPSLHSQAIFTMTVNQASTIEFFTGVYGNGTTGLDGWSKETVFAFPFDFDENPYFFTHLETTSDNLYRNCTLQVFYSIKRELAN